jgi:hypothetical protein
VYTGFITYVVGKLYDEAGRYEGQDSQAATSWQEVVIIIFTVSMLLYEYGEMCTYEHTLVPSVRAVIMHLTDKWNAIEMIGLAFVIVWMVLTYGGSGVLDEASNHAVLSLSVIFFSISLLRYLSISESLGKLIIMIFAMTQDVCYFAVVFSIVLYGFCVALYSIFRDMESFRSPSQTFLTLFSAAFGNYDNSFETLAEQPFKTLGLIVMLLYIVLSAVLLLNLIIARMAATHQRIDEQSFQQWLFTKTQVTFANLLIEETHPLCMLPPPLNFVPAVCFPFHFAMIQYKRNTKSTEPFLSVSGTVADIFVGIIMMFIAPVLEFLRYLRRATVTQVDTGNAAETFSTTLELLWMIPAYPIIYFFYVCSLFREVAKIRTRMRLSPTDGACLIEYPRKKAKSEDSTTLLEEDDELDPETDIVIIRVVRAKALKKCKLRSNPLVRIRYGGTEATTQPSLSGGCNPVWNQEYIRFSLLPPGKQKIWDIATEMTFEVVDYDALLGEEKIVGHMEVSIKEWITNESFDGTIPLRDGDGELEVHARIRFPSFWKPSLFTRPNRSESLAERSRALTDQWMLQINERPSFFEASSKGVCTFIYPSEQKERIFKSVLTHQIDTQSISLAGWSYEEKFQERSRAIANLRVNSNPSNPRSYDTFQYTGVGVGGGMSNRAGGGSQLTPRSHNQRSQLMTQVRNSGRSLNRISSIRFNK